MAKKYPKWTANLGYMIFKDVEFKQNGSTLIVYRKSQDGIRDGDEDLCYELYVELFLPKLEYISTGRLEFKGYVKELLRYPEGDSIPVHKDRFCDGGKYCKSGEVHDTSDSYLPPVYEEFESGLYLLELRDY